MDQELKDAIRFLTDEISSLAADIEELRKVNKDISEKLYLTNEYLSTRD